MKKLIFTLLILFLAPFVYAGTGMNVPVDDSGNLLPTFVASSAEYDNGNCATTKTITLANGTNQKLALTGNCILTIVFPSDSSVSSIFLRLYQDGTGSRTMNWNGFIKWPGGSAPTLTTTANAHDDIALKCYHGESKCEAAANLDMK